MNARFTIIIMKGSALRLGLGLKLRLNASGLGGTTFARRFATKEAAASERPGYRRAALRMAERRREVSMAGQSSSSSSSSSSTNAVMGTIAALGLGAAGFAYYSKDSEQVKSMKRTVKSFLGGFTEPTREKLLPDFPPLPPGHTALRTLVVDLEDTLVHLEWDRKFGWRTAKRPGVDEFLMRMCRSYEIVVFTSGHFHFFRAHSHAA